jgi:hypothetical protein
LCESTILFKSKKKKNLKEGNNASESLKFPGRREEFIKIFFSIINHKKLV